MATVEVRQFVTVDATVRGVPEKAVVEWVEGGRLRLTAAGELLFEIDRAELEDGIAKLMELAKQGE